MAVTRPWVICNVKNEKRKKYETRIKIIKKIKIKIKDASNHYGYIHRGDNLSLVHPELKFG